MSEDKIKDVGSEWTSWLVIAAEYHYLTGMSLRKPELEGQIQTLEQNIRYFRCATKQMWYLTKTKERQFTNNKNLLGTMGFPNMGGLKGRLKIRKP